MTRPNFLQHAAARLEEAGVGEPLREARALCRAALGLEAAAFLAQDDTLSADQEKKLQEWLERRARREPLARLRGAREFWKASFVLNEATLEPRADSETLIEAAVELFSGKDLNKQEDRIPLPPGGVRGGSIENTGKDVVCGKRVPSPLPPPGGRGNFPRNILDLGTGTGCLLLSLLQEFPNATGLGTDKSARALQAAQENAAALGMASRARLLCADWAEGIAEKFDLVVSNPPYISSKHIPGLQPEVRLFDPLLALDGGEDGLQAYREMAAFLPRLLNENGAAILEIGQGQEKDVAEIFAQVGLKNIGQKKDLSGITRALVFRARG